MLAQTDLSFWDEVKNSLEEIVTTILDFVPNVAGAILLLLLGMFISRIVVRAVRAVLGRLQFDHWVDRSGLGSWVERAGYPDSGHLLARIVGWVIMLVFINMAVDTLGLDSVTELVNGFIEWIPKVLIAILLVIITGIVANFARDTLSPTLANTTGGGILMKVLTVMIWVFGGTLAFRELEFGEQIIDQLWTAVTTGLVAIIVIKFGIGGIWAARDRFWPKVYDALEK